MHLDAQWVAGFVDGEGRFHVTVKKRPSASQEFSIDHKFIVVQNHVNVQTLFALKAYFKCGSIRRTHYGQVTYQVKSILHLLGVIVPFFEKHPLKTKKRIVFQKFRKILLKVQKKEHVTPSSIQVIRVMSREMNCFQAKIESDPFRNNRDQSSEIPCRVSSDLHEWRNDLGTVSTRDSVKL